MKKKIPKYLGKYTCSNPYMLNTYIYIYIYTYTHTLLVILLAYGRDELPVSTFSQRLALKLRNTCNLSKLTYIEREREREQRTNTDMKPTSSCSYVRHGFCCPSFDVFRFCPVKQQRYITYINLFIYSFIRANEKKKKKTTEKINLLIFAVGFGLIKKCLHL